MSSREFIYLIGDCQDAFEFGSKVNPPIFSSVKQGLDTQKIPGREHILTVRDYKGKDRIVKTLQHISAILLVEMKKQPLLSIGVTGETSALGMRQYIPIADLSIITDSKVIISGIVYGQVHLKDIVFYRVNVPAKIVLAHEDVLGFKFTMQIRTAVKYFIYHFFKFQMILVMVNYSKTAHGSKNLLSE
jgi:hypothetical protein